MNITITTVKHDKQRYRTVGDWIFDNFGNLSIIVSDTGDNRKNICIAIHELVEAVLCESSGITTEVVDDFDMNHLDLDEPGNSPEAPYHKQHRKAEIFEFMLASNLGIDWTEYCKKIESL